MNIKRHNFITVFRAPDDGSGNGQGGNVQPDGAKQGEVDKTVPEQRADSAIDDGLPKTREEVERLLQIESDRRVTQALKKHAAEREKAIEAAVAEAIENEKLSAKEREEKARRKELELIEQGKREVAEGKRQLLIVDKMTSMKVPDAVMAMRNSITAQDEDGIITEIKGMMAVFEAGKAAAMKDRLAQAAITTEGHDVKPGDAVKSTGDPVLDALKRASQKDK